MPKFANQRTVTIDKSIPKTNFGIYDKNDMAVACQVLNGSAFKVWCYLLSNSEGAKWNISPKHAQEVWGISQSSFSDGIKELIKKGFYNPNDKKICAQSSKPLDEIRKPKRKSAKSEIQNSNTKIENTHSEIYMSNNINMENSTTENTVDANASTNNNDVVNRTSAIPNDPEVEEEYDAIWRASSIDYSIGTQWRKEVKNGIYISPIGKKIKVVYDD